MGANSVIGYLEGKVRWKTKNKVIINVRGTGYLVFVSDQYQIPQK
ncbi:MAG: OB-fold domain-containing protein, partial [Bacillota bacterium]